MFRQLLVITLCLALAAMNLAGAHVHFVDDQHDDHEHAAQVAEHGHEHGAHAISALDQHHDDEHGHEGGLDLDPAVKAFGKLSVTLVPVLALWFFVLAARFAAGLGLQLPRAAPLRPPNRRAAFYILPPSHAPPATAFAR